MNLDEVAHLAGVGGFEFDAAGRTLRVSESLGQMLHCPAQLPWATVMTCLDEPSRKRLRAGWRKARHGAPTRITVLATVRCRQFWFQVDLAPVATTDRGDITLKGCVVDITGYVACEQQLIAAATEARQHAGASGSLLSALSHEIRTPLGSILGLSRIGEQESTGRSIQALFQRIEKSGKYLLEVVDKILDYSALKADRLVLEHTVVRTADLIDRSMDLVAERAQAKRLALLVDESPGLPETFIGDGLRITQVMVNLLGNAIKFTDRGHVLLRVRATREMLRIEVEDTGIGIDAQHLERLFQPFVQADASTARRYGGSGLGLAISRDLATAMNGRLEVDSTTGQGSRFSFTLPLRQPRWPDTPGMMPATVIRLAGLPEPQSRHLSAQLSDRGCAVECVPVEDAYLLPLPTCVVVPRRSALTHPQPSGLKLRTLWTLEHGELPPEPEQGAIEECVEAPLRARHILALATHEALRRRAGIHDQRILVADDCPLNRLIVEDILRRAGARTVALFESGTDAICEIVTREPNYYGAAILDIQMPGMDGIETATQLRNIAPQMPIIALSGDSDPAVHTRARDAGVVAFLTKPVADDALLAAISGETTSGQWSATSGAMAAPDVGESHVFDLRRMQRRFEGHETLVHKLLDTFRQRHLETSTKLQAAIVRDDWTTIGQIAHTLKGMAGHLHAIELYLAAQTVSSAIQHQGLAAHPYVITMQAALARLMRALDALPMD